MSKLRPATERFDVGGVMLDQPFKIRRLGHVGLNLTNMAEALSFYTEVLGFRISDTIDFSERATSPDEIAGLGDPRGYFMRYGSDHHAFVLFNRRVREALDKKRQFKPEITINQITWQVGSLREVSDAISWFEDTGVRMQRVGRDMPGSNWHTYMYDPDGHTNELYYGIEQIGWSGHSKPPAMYNRGFDDRPALPQVAEYQEVDEAAARGVDLLSGSRHSETSPAAFEVDGIMMPRPFKIVRLGPVRLFVEDLEAASRFYVSKLGFTQTEEVGWNGHRSVFLRANTEHHSLALYPIAMREDLGLSTHTTSLSIGLQLANYRQLRDALAFAQERGVRAVELPPEVHPGIDYAAHIVDPDGHLIELYFSMEQIGWAGQPRAQSRRRPVAREHWPTTIEAQPDTYTGEPYLGPWA